MSADASPSTQSALPARKVGRLTLMVEVGLPAAASAVAEGLLISAYAGGRIGWPVLISAHAAIVGLLALWSLQTGRGGRNAVLPLLTTIAVTAAGPIGALAAILTIVLAAPGRDDPQRLQEWYDRIALAGETDEVTRLCEQVATGRTTSLTGEVPASFAAVMERGSLDDRQTALGIIARNFHPDYLPVLMLALKSPEPMIRVQAAAVATRVRTNLRALVDRHAVSALDLPTGDALGAAAQLEAAIASGLLDEGDRIRADIIAERLKRARTVEDRSDRIALAPVLERATNEDMLLRQGRFAEWRTARRIAAVADTGRYRVRRAARRAATERA